jgi:hypothetical protein
MAKIVLQFFQLHSSSGTVAPFPVHGMDGSERYILATLVQKSFLKTKKSLKLSIRNISFKRKVPAPCISQTEMACIQIPTVEATMQVAINPATSR